MNLAKLFGIFASGLNESDLRNAIENRFVVNFDNGRTLGFTGEKEINNTDVVSEEVGFKLLVRLSGGPNVRIEPPFIVFTNKEPIIQ